MKNIRSYIFAIVFICGILPAKETCAQGKVVINEYMPWTSNGCGVTAEFVELLNFGPGPVDIGCYILTDGDYSVTIPPHTILQPGQFYVIAGQDALPAPCANVNADIHADLNWRTCGCASGPVPITGNGFFTDGGMANEQVVLLDPHLNVIDAVVRDYPVEPSSLITSAGGDCSPQTFDLDDMNIHYETLGMSTGRGNSFARKLDGDCGWVKTPQQSGAMSNNTSGTISDVSYQFSYVDAEDCNDNHGSIYIMVKKSNYDGFFPMKYTIAFDADDNNVFDFSDTYTSGVDDSPPDIFISGLPSGHYMITVGSDYGCSLKTFEFRILPCQPLLPVQLAYFRYQKESSQLVWTIDETEGLDKVVLEMKSRDSAFVPLNTYHSNGSGGIQYFSAGVSEGMYRLKIIQSNGHYFYSSQLRTSNSGPFHVLNGSVSGENLALNIRSDLSARLPFSIHDLSGRLVSKGIFLVDPGTNQLNISLGHLPAGLYQLVTGGTRPVSFRFVKH